MRANSVNMHCSKVSNSEFPKFLLFIYTRITTRIDDIFSGFSKGLVMFSFHEIELSSVIFVPLKVVTVF